MPPPRPVRPPKLRLVKVVVQPIFVLDDGEHITELEHPAVAIPAEDWPNYSNDRFPREVDEWQARIDAEYVAGDSNVTGRSLGSRQR